MRSLSIVPVASLVALGLTISMTTVSCGSDADGTQDAVSSLPPYQGPSTTLNEGQGTSGTQPSVSTVVGGNNPEGTDTGGGVTEGNQGVMGNVGMGNVGMDSNQESSSNDGNNSQETSSDEDTEPPVSEMGEPNVDNNAPPLGRIGAERCTTGDVGAPTLDNLNVQVFSRQADNVGGGFNWEGVVWTDGALYWSQIADGSNVAQIHRKVPGQDTEYGFIADSGSNGLAIDANGDLVAATHLPSGQISRFALPGGTRTLGAEQFNGQAFNSPNDLVIRSDGNIYFTDPSYQAGGNEPQPANRVYRISPSGDVSIVDASYDQPNGVTLSPDGNTLYVAGGPLQAYPLDGQGVPGDPVTLNGGLNSPDGMTVDCAGNVYVAEYGGRDVRVFSADGNDLGRINSDLFNSPITNVAFGGPDMRTLYISGPVNGSNSGGIFSVEMSIPGMPY